MVRSTGVRDEAEPRTGDRQSLGDLVAQASRDISQLVRYEIALATAELKSDARRVGAVSALCGFAAFIGCLILVMLSFALAYGLQAAKVPGTSQLYVCFLYTAAIWFLLALLMVSVALLVLKRFSKMEKTRKTVTGDLEMLRHRDGASPALPKSESPALPKS